MLVAGDCFATLQVQPVLGRFLGPEEAPFQGKGSAVAMLGYGYWQRMFGGASDVIGKTIRIETATVTIVGVLPHQFTGINRDLDAALVVPFNSYRTDTAATRIIVRLRGSRQLEQVDSQLRAAWTSALDDALPAALTDHARRASLDAQPEVLSGRAGHSTLRNQYGATFVNTAWLAALLVLLTSINVGGLLCSRLASKLPELADSAWTWRDPDTDRARRTARSRVAVSWRVCDRPAPGLRRRARIRVAAPEGRRAVDHFVHAGRQSHRLGCRHCDARGAGDHSHSPWLATRHRVLIRGTDRSVTRATYRSGQVLLVLRIAVTLVLVFGCGLLVRSLVALEHADRGYGANDVLSIRLTSTAGGYRALDQPTYYRELVETVAAMPAVTSVGMARYFGTIPDERAWYEPVS